MDNNFKKFVEGKRVVLVGPAPHLSGEGKGKWIDDHDIIVRPNQFHIPEKIKIDYGSRTDIMSHNFGTLWMNGLKDNIEKNKEQFDKLLMLMCPVLYGTRGKEENYMSWSEDHIGDVVHNAQSINTNQIPFWWIGPKRYQKLFNSIGCQPYTGLLTICMLLECPIESLYVTGFDFYESDKVYVDGIHNPLDGPEPKKGGGHGETFKQIEYLKNIHQDINKLYVDDKLQNIFDKL